MNTTSSAIGASSSDEFAETHANALLSIEGLDAQAASVITAFLEAGTPPNTARSYGAALRYLNAWYSQRFAQTLENQSMTPAAAMQFVIDHLPQPGKAAGTLLHPQLPDYVDKELVRLGVKKSLGPLKSSTVIHRLAVLSKWHKLRNWECPTDDARFRTLLRAARNVQIMGGEKTRKKTAAAKDQLMAMVAACDDGTLAGKRDKALLLCAWASGGRRRSEAVGIQLSDLTRVKDGLYLLALGRTKTEMTGDARQKPIRGDAAKALDEWWKELEEAGITNGPAFRSLRRGPKTGPKRGPKIGTTALSPGELARIVKKRAEQAGVPGDWAAHSLRSGFITEAGRRGLPLADVMAMTEHKSVQTVMGYYQAGHLQDAAVGNMLESNQEEES